MSLPLFQSRTRLDELVDAFADYHRANPRIFALFCRFALEVARVRSHYSAWAIVQRIRWHVEIETRSADELKINNNWAALYARLFSLKHPEHENLFRCRKMTTAEKPASGAPFVHHTGPPGDESELFARLRELA